MEDKLSIIAPVYNVEKYLDRFIGSILSQTYKNWELILIDDGSTDESGRICDRYAAQNERIKVCHQANGGVSGARNHGIELSDGEYYLFADSDDWLEADMIEVLMCSIMENGSDMSVCDTVEIDELNNIVKTRNSWKNTAEVLDKEGSFYELFLNSSTLWNKVFSKNVIKYCRFDETLTYGEDMMFLLDALGHIRKTSMVKEAKYNYVINRPGNVVSSKLDKRSFEFLHNGLDTYKKLKSIGYADLGIAKFTAVIIAVLTKIVQQDPENKGKYLSYIKKLIWAPDLLDLIKFYRSRRISDYYKKNRLIMRTSINFWLKWKSKRL